MAIRAKRRNALLIHFHMTAGDQRMRERDAELTGEMVVAGSRRPQRCIARTRDRSRSHRLQPRRHSHDAFHHLRIGGRCAPVILVVDSASTDRPFS